jgi:hypothetical protein
MLSRLNPDPRAKYPHWSDVIQTSGIGGPTDGNLALDEEQYRGSFRRASLFQPPIAFVSFNFSM